MDDGSNNNSVVHVSGQGSFIPAGKAIEAVVVNLAARRDQTKVSKIEARKIVKGMLDDSVRQLNELERANGHLILAWKIYVAECGSVEDAHTKIAGALISITSQPVTQQE